MTLAVLPRAPVCALSNASPRCFSTPAALGNPDNPSSDDNMA